MTDKQKAEKQNNLEFFKNINDTQEEIFEYINSLLNAKLKTENFDFSLLIYHGNSCATLSSLDQKENIYRLHTMLEKYKIDRKQALINKNTKH